MMLHTFDLGAVSLRLSHQQSRCLAIQWIGGIGVQQQLRQESLKDVQQVCSDTNNMHEMYMAVHRQHA